MQHRGGNQKSDDPESLHPTRAWNEYVMLKDVIHFQKSRETTCAGKASPELAAPAAAVTSFHVFIHLNTEVLPT